MDAIASWALASMTSHIRTFIHLLLVVAAVALLLPSSVGRSST